MRSMLNIEGILGEILQNLWSECENKDKILNNIFSNTYSHSKKFTISEYLPIIIWETSKVFLGIRVLI